MKNLIFCIIAIFCVLISPMCENSSNSGSESSGPSCATSMEVENPSTGNGTIAKVVANNSVVITEPFASISKSFTIPTDSSSQLNVCADYFGGGCTYGKVACDTTKLMLGTYPQGLHNFGTGCTCAPSCGTVASTGMAKIRFINTENGEVEYTLMSGTDCSTTVVIPLVTLAQNTSGPCTDLTPANDYYIKVTTGDITDGCSTESFDFQEKRTYTCSVAGMTIICGIDGEPPSFD